MDWKLSKRYPTPEDKEEAISRCRSGGYVIQATPYLLDGNPHRLETGSQRLTYRSESSETHIKPSRVGIWHWEKEPLEHLALKANGACDRSSMGLGETETPFLKGAHGLSRALGPRAKQSLYRNLGQT